MLLHRQVSKRVLRKAKWLELGILEYADRDGVVRPWEYCARTTGVEGAADAVYDVCECGGLLRLSASVVGPAVATHRLCCPPPPPFSPSNIHPPPFMTPFSLCEQGGDRHGVWRGWIAEADCDGAVPTTGGSRNNRGSDPIVMLRSSPGGHIA